MDEKKALRARLRQMRKSFSPHDCEHWDNALSSHLLSLPEYARANTIFCYVSTPEEPGTQSLMAFALADGKQLCVPRCREGGQMDLCLISSLADLRPGAYGLLEPGPHAIKLTPDEVDLAIIPCIACTRDGQRLGQGGGYYDRFLPQFSGDAVLLCREALVLDTLPAEPHDCIVPTLVTEAGVFRQGKPEA